MRRTTRTRLSALVALGLAATLPVLTACTPGRTPAPVAATPVAREPSALPKMDGKTRGVVKDVELATCDLEAGGVTAKGTVRNTLKKKADFAITIAWMPNNSSDPVGVASTTVDDLAAGESAEWSINTTLTGKADRCAINARRGTLA